MRKITKHAIHALCHGMKFSQNNTMVDGQGLWLHGTQIIRVADDGVYITTGGWNTTTTKERLNGLPNVRVYHHRHQLYLNDSPWDGNWIKVHTDLVS
jgi:hypothetical protein